jgi:hypothetical protein
MSLLAPVFRDELLQRWHLRNARRFPEGGVVPACSDRLAAQLDGSEAAMTAGLADVIGFLDS